MPDGGSAWVAAAVAAAATHGLAALALQRGWIDQRRGAEERKPRTAPVPLVGGAALLCALVAWDLSGGGGLPWLALLGAFLLGLVDDLLPGGLTPRSKFRGQLAVALCLALFPASAGVAGEGFGAVLDRCALAIVAVVAMNAVNTFDNSDGAAGILGLAALWPVGGARGGLAGYLPFNFLRRPLDLTPRTWAAWLRLALRGPRDSEPGAGRPPRAMLGDSGSHVLGVLVAATPGAEAFLLVPLLDLGRLAIVRERLGRRPWQGDRRHLAHRLEALGFGPLLVGAALVGILLPTWLAARIGSGAELLPLGLLGSAALYFLALYLTPDPDLLGPDKLDTGGPSPDHGAP